MTTIALDVHAHLLPILPDRLVNFPDVVWTADDERLTIDGRAVTARDLFRPAALLAWMAREGVAHVWISAPPPAYRQHLRNDAAYEWSAYLNAALQEAAREAEGTMTALLHLPTQDPEAARRIVADAVDFDHRLFAMPTGSGDDRTLSDPEYAPLWSALDALKAFVFLHPGECADGRLAAFYLANLLGNPSESAVAVSHLVLGGVLERYSDIRFCVAHGGGTFPMVAGRIQRGFDTQRPGVDTTLAPPMTSATRLTADCICHSEAALELAEIAFGQGNVVFGSDWPFPMGLLSPGKQLSGYGAERRRRLDENSAALRRIYGPRGDEE